MTESLPGQPPTIGPPPRRRELLPDAAAAAVSKATVRALPRIPDRMKRLMLGGRSVTIDGNTLDVTLQFLLAGQRAAGMGGLVASDDVDIAREQLRAQSAAFSVPLQVEADNLTLTGPAGPVPARHYWPPGGAAEPSLLVFYHGGGWVLGDLDTHDSLCRLICRDAGIHVLSVDYRQPPEHQAPAAVDDAYAAYRWVLDHAEEFGADPARVVVGGDSAGGNLAAVVSQRCRNDGVPLPALQLLIYPATRMGADTRSRTLFADGFFLRKRDMDWCEHHYLHGSAVEPTDPLVSPLLADDLSGLPPALLVTAGFDPLRDEGHQYAEALRAAEVTVDLREYGSLIHGFVNMFPLGGGSASATAEIISALRAHLSHA